MSTEITSTDVSENFRRIAIQGRLDIAGSDSISLKFAAYAVAAGRRVLVDLTGVTFLASIGIRSIISNAKALQARGGKMVLFVGGNASVAKTLETTGVDTLIPMFADAVEAEAAALA
jgi:anti-sigma B factor antagonist